MFHLIATQILHHEVGIGCWEDDPGVTSEETSKKERTEQKIIENKKIFQKKEYWKFITGTSKYKHSVQGKGDKLTKTEQ